MKKKPEILDYRESVKAFSEAKQIVEEGDSHGFDGVERHFPLIETFLDR